MTREEADSLVEKALTGTVVGTTTNCVSIQWEGREAPEIYTPDDIRNISKAGEKK